MWATLCGVVQVINSGCGLHCVVWYRSLTVDVGYTVYDVVQDINSGCGLHCVVWYRSLTVDVGYTVYDVVQDINSGCGLHCVRCGTHHEEWMWATLCTMWYTS